MEESIYNIIPEEIKPIRRGKMYKSQLPSYIPPTGSTFGTQSKVIPIRNVSGSYDETVVRYGSESGVIGKSKTQKLSPIRAKIMGTNSLKVWMQKGSIYKSVDMLQDRKMKLKPLLPKLNETPILGLKSSKNYIAANAIEAILSNPRTKAQEPDWLQKESYGKVPLYLSQIKDELHQSYVEQMEAVKREKEQENNRIQLVADEELDQLRKGLKQRYDEVNKLYQLQTHQKIFDTLGMKRRKELYEKEMTQLEKDMAKVNKSYVFVEHKI